MEDTQLRAFPARQKHPAQIAGGTGAYKGISGSGRSTIHNTFVEQVVNGHCASAFTAVQSLITASGPVSLP